MNVKQFIKRLKQFDPELPVVVSDKRVAELIRAEDTYQTVYPEDGDKNKMVKCVAVGHWN